jgi:hypothetical protein
MLEFGTFSQTKIRRNAPPGSAPALAALRDAIILK